MHRLRSPGPIGSWALVLGLFLAIGPLVQSPCSWAAAPAPTAPDAIMTSVAPGAQWTCAESAPAPLVRAVSPERSEAPLHIPSGDTPPGPTELAPADVRLHVPSPPVSATLDALRAVVLQI